MKIKPRTWMTEARERKGMTMQTLGKHAGCSEDLICWLEGGQTITHPNIAARIVHALGGSVSDYNGLVHASRRVRELPEAPPLLDDFFRDWPSETRCLHCCALYVPSHDKQKFCSVSCASAYRCKAKKEGDREES